MTALKLLLPEQVAELQLLEAAIQPSLDFESTCRLLVARLAAILDSAVGILVGHRSSWRLAAKAGEVPSLAAWLQALDLPATVLDDRYQVPTAVSVGGTLWTCVSLAASRPIVLCFDGDWTLSQLLMLEQVQRLAGHLDHGGPPPPSRRMMTAYAFSRRLARATDVARLYQLIVEACAKAVFARKASIAVYDREERTLRIPATYGYPELLVRHLRCHPDAGVIGSVFSSGRPVLVKDVRVLAGESHPRLRYDTNSFMSIPLTGFKEILGVVNVTDRRDNCEFDRRDLSTIRGLAGVAGLALDRFQAIDDARTSAHIAAVDAVTGLYNRRYCHARLDEEMERARRQGTPLTVMFLDIDGFKQLNDRFGHPAGDAMLRTIGEILQRSVRLFDVCCRYGGDEFAILMPGSSVESSAQIAERIRIGIEDCRPPNGAWGDDIRVSASIGIATTSGDQSVEDVIARADHALYDAKHEGKNRTSRW